MSNLTNVVVRESIVKKIQARKPFAVMVYHEWLKSDKDTCFKKYEVIDIQFDTFVTYKLSSECIRFFRENKHLFIQKLADDNGGVYEFNRFSDLEQFKYLKSQRDDKTSKTYK
jgi:hypothetical protein